MPLNMKRKFPAENSLQASASINNHFQSLFNEIVCTAECEFDREAWCWVFIVFVLFEFNLICQLCIWHWLPCDFHTRQSNERVSFEKFCVHVNLLGLVQLSASPNFSLWPATKHHIWASFGRNKKELSDHASFECIKAFSCNQCCSRPQQRSNFFC